MTGCVSVEFFCALMNISREVIILNSYTNIVNFEHILGYLMEFNTPSIYTLVTLLNKTASTCQLHSVKELGLPTKCVGGQQFAAGSLIMLLALHHNLCYSRILSENQMTTSHLRFPELSQDSRSSQ